MRKLYLFLVLTLCVNVLCLAQEPVLSKDKLNGGGELRKGNSTTTRTVTSGLVPATDNSLPAKDLYKEKGLSRATTPANIPTFDWTGIISTAWETAGNWSSNLVPIATSKVVIPPGKSRYPVVNMTTTIKSLNCLQGATVTVASGVVLHILQ